MTLWSDVVKIQGGITDTMYIFNIFGRVWCSPMVIMIYIIHLWGAKGHDENSILSDFVHIFYYNTHFLFITFGCIFSVFTVICQLLSSLIMPR